MEKLYDVAAVREIENAAFAREDSFAVMRRAGEAVAECAREMFGGAGAVLVLAGGGNNGGDALVAAAKLRETGAEVKLVCLLWLLVEKFIF